MTSKLSVVRPLVLVVEDDPGIATLESELIEDLGCEVASVTSGKAVLDWLANSTAAPTRSLRLCSAP